MFRARALSPFALLLLAACGSEVAFIPDDDAGNADVVSPSTEDGGSKAPPGDDAGGDVATALADSGAVGDDASDAAIDASDFDAADAASDAGTSEPDASDAGETTPDASDASIDDASSPVDASAPDATTPPPVDAGSDSGDLDAGSDATPPSDAGADSTVPPPPPPPPDASTFDAGTCVIPTSAFTAPDPTAATPPAENAPFGDEVRELSLAANGLTYDANTRLLFATTPSANGASGNAIVAIDPVTATIVDETFVGSEPTKLAASRDGKYLYTNLRGADAIVRFDIAKRAVDLQFALGSDSTGAPYDALDLAVLPASPRSVIVALGTSQGYSGGVAVFDDDVQRPVVAGPTYPYYYSPSPLVLASNDDALAFAVDQTTYYPYQGGLDVLCVNAQGVYLAESHAVFSGSVQQVAYASPIVYGSSGAAFDVSKRTLAGTYGGSATSTPQFTGLAIDAPADRAYFLEYTYVSPSTFGLVAYDRTHFTPTGSIAIPPLPSATGAQLVRWGRYGLAYLASDGHVVLVRSTIVAQP